MLEKPFKTMKLQFGDKIYDYSKPEPEVVKAAEYLCQQGKQVVLDLGCGAGRHLLYLAQKFKVYGLDKDQDLIKKAASNLPKLRDKLRVGNMTATPYGDQFFDAVIANQVIYHGTKAQMSQTIKEIYRILKPKGLFFVTLQPREGQAWRLGKLVEPWTYVTSAGPDKGDTHHFVYRKEIDGLFGKKHLISVYQDNRNDWCVYGKK